MSHRNSFARRRRSPQQHRAVYVHRYRRFRLGQWEDVTDHYRSWPTQLAFDF